MASYLPWPWFYRLGLFCCHFRWLYNDGVNQALKQVSYHLNPVDSLRWKKLSRWTRWIDYADPWLLRTRSDQWINRHLEIRGTWPPSPFIGIGFHLGTGFWAIRHARNQGHRIAFLSAQIPTESTVRLNHERAGLTEVERTGGAPLIFTGGSLAKISQQLSQGISIVGLMDAPHSKRRSRKPVQFFGKPAYFADGLLYAAQTNQVPIAAFTCIPDPETGKRILHIQPIDPHREDALQVLVSILEDQIIQMPWAWHFWQFLEDFWNPASRE